MSNTETSNNSKDNLSDKKDDNQLSDYVFSEEQKPSEEPEQDKPNRMRGIYILPNLFTTGALFAGFYAIIQAMNHQFETASIAIFIAMVMDGLDGRVARLTNTESAFGAEYDSLSDMVSFGVAPALLSYEWALRTLGKWGWLASFVYCAGAALRLARFNTQLGIADKKFFQGLPSPAAAALVSGMVWVSQSYNASIGFSSGLAWLITMMAGLTMVSNIKYYSFKDINLRKSVPFVAILLIVLSFILVSINPPTILFLLFFAYLISGYAIQIWRFIRHRKKSQTSTLSK